jgi:hypothetical protein
MRLTAFERFQYWETRPGYPNQIVAVLDYLGDLDSEVLLRATGIVLARHPLLSSRIETHGPRPRRFHWPQPLPAAVQRLSADPTAAVELSQLQECLRDFVQLAPQADAWEPAGVEDLLPVNPATGVAFRLTILFNRQRCRWILQTHHVVCDGVGGLQAIRELIQVYHWLKGGRREAFPLRPLQLERLQRRGRLLRGRTGSGLPWDQLWKLPMKWIGLFGASKFLLRRPVRLDQRERPAGTSASREGRQICWLDGRLTVGQTKRLRQLARESRVTVNSLILAHWLVALDLFRRQRQAAKTTDCYRLMVPTNERTGGDVGLSACNQVSMVYVDRWPREMEYVEALAAGIDFEMSVIRRWSLSNTFVVALTLFSWVPGLVRWYAQRPSCWATSYVTNLGSLLGRLQVGQTPDRRAEVGGLTLNQIRLLPPLRPALPAALAVCVYAEALQVTLHHDANCLPRADAEQLLVSFMNRLKT